MNRLKQPTINFDLAVEVLPYIHRERLAFRMGQQARVECSLPFGKCKIHSDPFGPDMLSAKWRAGWIQEDQDIYELKKYQISPI